MKECPYCAEQIANDAIVCKYCGENIENKNTKTNKDYYENHSDFFMSLFKSINWAYVWAVIINILELLVVIGIYNNIYESFEIIVVSILIVIYLTVRSVASGRALQKPLENLAILGEFRKIKGLLIKNKNEEDEEQEKIEEVKSKLKIQQIKIYINIGFYFIIYIIAVFNLIQQLLN